MRIFVPSAALVLTDHRPFGEGLIAWEMLDGLARRGHDVVACANRVDLAREPRFRVVELGRSFRFESVEPLVQSRRTARLFGRLAEERPFDIAHWLFPQADDELIPSLPARLPLVIGPLAREWPPGTFVREREIGDYVRAALQPVFGWARRRTWTRADRILVATPQAAERVPPRFRDKCEWVPFGVDVDAFEPTAPLPERPRVLFLGRLDVMKGVRELVSAFESVHRAMPDAELVIAGDGPERAWIEEQVDERGLASVVRLLGPVPRDETVALLRECWLLALPSRGEPFGMAVLEAMASGRAVVATDEGGPRTTLEDGRGGRLVPREDPEQLATTMLEFLADREKLAAMGSFNRERVRRVFSLEHVLDEVERVYRSVCRMDGSIER